MTTGGPVGYLLTDIDGSVVKWEKDAAAMKAALARHDELLRAIIEAAGGEIVEHTGDGVFARFRSGGAIACALNIQRAVRGASWNDVGGLSIRIALHVGFEGPEGDRDRPALNRTARMRDAAWAGQTIVSSAAIASFGTPGDAILSDLGGVYLRGIDEPQRLFSLTSADFGKEDYPALRGAARQGSRLPTQSTPIFGRERELLDLSALVQAGHNWITLTGAGGVGKTRLALEFAARAAHDRDVYLVQLGAGASDDRSLARALSGAMRLQLRPGAEFETILAEHLADKSAVIVVDNADGSKEVLSLLEPLLRAAPRTIVLTTAREPFLGRHERVYKLSGLATPSAREEWMTSPAAVLFAQSARGLDPKFAFKTADAHAFAAICEAVRGAPLGLHLTAQWVGVLPLADIAAKLGGGTQFLSTLEVSGAPTLRQVFDVSWELLTDDQQRVLAGIAIFPALFDASAAEAIAEASTAVLLELERKSLIEQRGAHRFALHPLVREFATAQLRSWDQAAQQDLARRHAQFYIDRCDADFSATLGAAQPVVAERARADFPNLRAAWAHILAANNGDAFVASAERMFYVYAVAAMYAEAFAIFSMAPKSSSLAAAFAALRASCLSHLGRYAESDAATLDARAMIGAANLSIRGHIEHVQGNNAHARGEWTEAENYYSAALALRANDDLGAFYSNSSLAWLMLHRGKPEEAAPFLEAADRLAERLSFVGGALSLRQCAGDLAVGRGQLAEAATCYRAAISLEYAFDNPQIRAMNRIKLGRVLVRSGDETEGKQTLLEARDMARECGAERESVYGLLALGEVTAFPPETTREYLGEALWRAVERLKAPNEIKQALIALARFEAKQSRAQKASELVSVARALEHVFSDEERDALELLGVDFNASAGANAVESAVLALVVEYRPSGVANNL